MSYDAVQLQIREEGPTNFADHGQIPISFEAKSRLDLDALRRHGRLEEMPMPPRLKDYDANEEDRPAALPERFDCTNWVLLAAFAGATRVGGAILVRDCLEFELLEGRPDLAHVVDIRVKPSFRGKGVGKALVKAAMKWASAKGCTELRVETQDINVDACRFYAACGFHLLSINENAYGPSLDEVQLIWQLQL